MSKQPLAQRAFAALCSSLLSINSIILISVGAAPFSLNPDQAADVNFNPNVARPAYTNKHPKVLFDEAHNNTETVSGHYKPFAELITNDGYTVTRNARSFTRSGLKGYDVLVIVNASGPQSQRASSAFTEEECLAVRDWVNSGGGLLLVADHLPFSSAMSVLSAKFEVDYTKGYTIDSSKYNRENEDQSELVFSRDEGLVVDHPITRGRDATERINRVFTFTGTSLKGPASGVQFLKLSDSALDVIPPPEANPVSSGAAPLDHKQVSAAGRAQGLALISGKGRVVAIGEAAMLTAQVTPRGYRYGMNVAGTDNRQLVLNIVHWLSGLLN